MSTRFKETLRDGVPFLIGDWLVEPTLNRLTRDVASVRLELKAMDVLLCLAEHAGEVVAHQVFLDEVWQTEFVSDETLKNRIAELRRALGDDARDPCYIETIHKRGYRLIAAVRPVNPAEASSATIPEAPPSAEDDQNPYPGLAAFTEADADRFFGREAEVAALWRKISARRLLAVIGPSGVGKSSLLRAGVAARAPPGWRVVVFTPGEAPLLSLARALAPDHAGDPTAMARLLGFSDADTALAVVSRWRGQFDQTVLVVDQFEELFTLNAPEVQASFIGLLRRLVDAADVHLLLAMRDDYLYRCQEHPQIAPIFESLTPLPPPTPEGLRRALMEPAARQLYRFESELLVDRMVAEVEGERGALPLMAFAVHRLWEERDREERLLTEEAYQRIGGVAGALARHADATLERIGLERLPIARELFRNLVTAEGTRAVRSVDELLSVFETEPQPLSSRARRLKAAESRDPPRSRVGRPDREGARSSRDPSTRPSDGLAQDDRMHAAEEVLRGLVDGRLLTGYRDQGDDDRPTRRVEIIHESLLTSWPRLVRWQAQDADSARLRDELRQAARLWDDHERASDYLWTGKAFRAFSVWREDYPGGLTTLEENFALAMTSRAQRQSRARRFAYTAALLVLLVVLGVVASSRKQAVAEARRAEAAKLLALGQLRREDYPTATLAHAISSLELADTLEARQLALRALWEGPTAFVVNTVPTCGTEFTSDGQWLVQSIQDDKGKQLALIGKDGSSKELDRLFNYRIVLTRLNPEGTVLFSEPALARSAATEVVLWSLPDGRKLSDVRIAPPSDLHFGVIGWNKDRFLALVEEGSREGVYAFNFDGTHERLGMLDLDGGPDRAMDLRTGRWLAAVDAGKVLVFEIGAHGLSTPRLLGRHEGSGHHIALDADGRFVASSSSDGRIKIWDPTGTTPPVAIDGPRDTVGIGLFGADPLLAARTEVDGVRRNWVYAFADGHPRLIRVIDSGEAGDAGLPKQLWGWDPPGRRYARNGWDGRTRMWSLSAPADAEPLELKRGDVMVDIYHSFQPGGEWFATADMSGLMLWPLSRPYPFILHSHHKAVMAVKFGPGGQWLASGGMDGIVPLIPLDGEVPSASRIAHQSHSWIRSLAWSADGEEVFVAQDAGGAAGVSLDGGASLPHSELYFVYGIDVGPDGRLAALTGKESDNSTALHLVSTDTLKTTRVVGANEMATASPRFLGDGRVVYSAASALWMLDPSTGATERLFEATCLQFAASEDGRRIALADLSVIGAAATSRVLVHDLEDGSQTHLTSHGDKVWSVAMDKAGTIVATGDTEGVLRVGSIDGTEPHLFLGHKGRIWAIDIDPRGRWIATGGDDGTVRIWPMPDLSKPPLHTLPHDELLAKLKSLTNVRVVRDEEDPTGWTLTHDPFPGWETVPTW